MTQAMTKKPTNWMPAVRHRRSQLGVLMRVSLVLVRCASLRDPFGSQSPQRLERRAEVPHEELRLLPLREVAALVVPVVEDELGIGLLRPALRGLIELLREGAHARRNGDVLRREEREMALPVETGRRDGRVREPVERDVVEDVVPRQTLGLSVEDADDERQAARVVVEHPGGQADGRVPDAVERLRAE